MDLHKNDIKIKFRGKIYYIDISYYRIYISIYKKEKYIDSIWFRFIPMFIFKLIWIIQGIISNIKYRFEKRFNKPIVENNQYYRPCILDDDAEPELDITDESGYLNGTISLEDFDKAKVIKDNSYIENINDENILYTIKELQELKDSMLDRAILEDIHVGCTIWEKHKDMSDFKEFIKRKQKECKKRKL